VTVKSIFALNFISVFVIYFCYW